MKKIKLSVATASLLMFVSFALFSFTHRKGGEGFEIYLNSKLVLQQFGSQLNNLKSIQLDQNSPNDELTIKYYHCGQAGKNRSITIKDGQNKVLKEWHFADVSTGSAAMTCKVKDITGLKKGEGPITFNLYYSSSELPKGRQLASLVVATQNMARL
jgi:flagellar hook assembly protein FlgD